MADVTQILSQIEDGNLGASERLLPLVYEELRRLAAIRLAREPSGATLQPTALVHEAFLKLVDGEQAQKWDSRGHFFAAAAEAMRRILVDVARRKQRTERGGGRERELLDAEALAAPTEDERLLELNDALDRLAASHPRHAELVKLRYFAGLTGVQAAEVLGISEPTAQRDWTYSRAWLFREMNR